MDWRAGDLCVHCNGPVRHDVRCFWCNAWGPAAGYCRECGAEQVSEANYGAARMLTQAGSDMFQIPKLIKEMDPGRLAVFAGKYAKQRASLARHIDDVLFVEQFCVQKGFAAELEEQWVSSLPWGEDIPPIAAPNDPLERLKVIEENALADIARDLAKVARIYLQDWSVFRDVMRATNRTDAVGVEAILASTWWRTLTSHAHVATHQFPVRELAELPFPEEVAVRLAYLGREFDAEAVARARIYGGVDLQFAAVLAEGNVGELAPLLLDPDEDVALAAGRTLARRGHLAALDPWLRTVSPDVQNVVLRPLADDKNRDAGVLREALLAIIEASTDEYVTVACGRILARHTTVDVAVRVALACRGEIYVVQALMAENTGLKRHELGQVAEALASKGYLATHKYGVNEAARRGAFPDDLIVKTFATADEQQRIELCRIAEEQLAGNKSEVTHVALMRIVFGPYDAKVRAAAWWALSRWYASQPELGYRSNGPMALEPSAIARFFPSVSEFLRLLINVLGDYPTLKEVGYYDFLNHLFQGVDAARARALDIDPALTRELTTAIRAAAAWDVWAFLKSSLEKTADLLLASKAA